MNNIYLLRNMKVAFQFSILVINNLFSDGLVLSHLPDGPTAYFKINTLEYTKQIKGAGESTSHLPEVILNNFKTRLGHTIGRMLACLFPHTPQYTGRRAVTFHNQRDYIFFRHHRYEFKENGERAALHELGPRFTLRLKWLQKGTYDTREGEYEWTLKRHEMKTSCLDFSLSVEDQEDNDWVDCFNELAITSFPNFNELRRSGHLCDVTIECQEGCVFRAHRSVLAATIPFFYVMFTTDMMESHSENIKISEIDAETMETILNFVYTGKIKFSSKNLEKIVRAADYFQLTIISDRCADLLTSRINAANVLGIRQFAIQHNSPQAVAVANRFIQRHFTEVVSGEEFLSLDFSTLTQILSWDELHVDSEEQTFEAAVKWLEHDIETRKILSPRVFAAVRMPLLKPSFLADEVSKNAIIRNSIECRDLVDEAKNFHLIPERRPLLHSFKITARLCSDVPGLIYAVGGFNSAGGVPIHRKSSASMVEMYDPLVGKWCLTKTMLSSRSRVGVVVVDRKMFVIGGYNGVDRLKCVEVFDSRTSTWEEAPSMIYKRSALCAAAVGDQIYVCGGYDGFTALSAVEAFDLKTEKWTLRRPMLSNRCAAAASVLNGFIYVMGGHNGVVIFNTMERYDPVTHRWEKVASMNTPRCRLSAVTLHGKIYAAGGYNSHFLNTFEVYDPMTDSWKLLAPMNTRRARVSLVANGSLLYAIGGYDGENNLMSMEIYNPATNKWDYGANMIAHEGGVGAGVISVSPKSPLAESNASKLLKRTHSGTIGEAHHYQQPSTSASSVRLRVGLFGDSLRAEDFREEF
ncbi:kelch motif domain-containing protein [Ditylenchus destructor]|uniref:Kelch motif domain-containing protein n=1 Tax=Ditylenchus destructor TaxID=166010 RepID=A0AAD4N2N8_9BILA|nr:kelch motif domain-containing protein [Ditylenchus destructor]